MSEFTNQSNPSYPTLSGDDDNSGWTTVFSRKRKNTVKSKTKSSSKILGVKSSGYNFRSADRSIDFFIGRVDVNVKEEDLVKYVNDNFQIDLVEIEKLDIVATNYIAFKLTINYTDREKLLNADMWPCGIIVDKFYNRRH